MTKEDALEGYRKLEAWSKKAAKVLGEYGLIFGTFFDFTIDLKAGEIYIRTIKGKDENREEMYCPIPLDVYYKGSIDKFAKDKMEEREKRLEEEREIRESRERENAIRTIQDLKNKYNI